MAYAHGYVCTLAQGEFVQGVAAWHAYWKSFNHIEEASSTDRRWVRE